MKIVPDQDSNPIAFPAELDRICAVAFEDNVPPWRNDQLWQVAGITIDYLVYRHGNQLDIVKKIAAKIGRLIDSIDPLLDRLETYLLPMSIPLLSGRRCIL